MSDVLANVPPRDIPRPTGGALVASAGTPVDLVPEIAQPAAQPPEPESGIGSLLDAILGGGEATPDTGSKKAAPTDKKPYYQQREDQGRD